MRIEFTAKLWEYQGTNPWFFITVPADLAQEIWKLFSHRAAGFGSLKVIVRIGDSEWQTSIFPDKDSNSYLLPVKKQVRKEQDLHDGSEVSVTHIF